MPQKLKQVVKQEMQKAEEQPKKRGFAGFKAKLNVNLGNFVASVDVRYARITSREIDEQLVIVMCDDKGNVVERKRIGEPYRYAFVNSEGEEVSEEQIYYLQVLPDGTMKEVTPFERTKELDTVKTISMADVENFLVEGIYELWSDNVEALSKIAIKLQEIDSAIVSKISFGGFREYYAIIYPIFKDGNFVLQMVLTRMRKEFSHWMPINGVKKVPEKIVSVLPEI